jgi:hypothetical protein
MTDLATNSVEVDERTRAFFERNLQARNKLKSETNKQIEKRVKLREEFGTESYLFDSWRGEQEQNTSTSGQNPSISSSTTNVTRPGPTDTLLATNIAAVQISDNTPITTVNNHTTDTDDKTEKNEE